jgi:hypothetical protein
MAGKHSRRPSSGAQDLRRAAETTAMNRSTPLMFLVALAGLGWACAFAAIGLGLFPHADALLSIGLVFGAFGFIGGAASTALRLAFEHHLPLDLAARLRGRGAGAVDDALPGATAPASAFGGLSR